MSFKRGQMNSWEVSTKESGMKLLAFLKEKLNQQYSARQLKRAIESNYCQINGKTERFATTVVGVGDQILFHLEGIVQLPERELKFEAERLLYEDSDLLIYDKPAGISSESEELLRIIQSHYSKGQLLHRLDRDTTGILMFTKNRQMHEAMVSLFRQQKVFKTYLALVDGIPAKRSGVIDNYLGKKHAYQGQALWGPVAAKDGLHAVTEWQIEKEGKGVALLQCFPKTGRTHQIRVHLSEMKHPILGDHQYGRGFRSAYRPKRCLLHAWKIAFDHPLKKNKVLVEAPVPQDFCEAIEANQR